MAKTIPANQITNEDFRNWVIKESVGGSSNSHIVVPEADQAYTQYDMCIAVPWCGIVDRGVDAEEELTMLVEEGIQIDTAQVEAGSTFPTFGGEVWYDPTTKLYADHDVANHYHVGYVILPLDSNGVFRFEKTRYTELSELS